MPEPRHSVEVFLQPGELCFGDRRTRIRTLLGSCVALVFWHPQRLIGGMCHYLLPSRRFGRPGNLDGCYGDEAIALLLSEIRAAGARPEEFDIRLFGGGAMFPGLYRGRAGAAVGRKNVEAARQIIGGYRLAFTAEHVEGNGYRNLVFDIRTGQVALRHRSPAHAAHRQKWNKVPCQR